MAQRTNLYALRENRKVVRAIQFRRPWDHADGEFGVCTGLTCDCPRRTNSTTGRLHVHTMHDEQAVVLEDGDWILPEPDGKHFYPVKADVFRQRYKYAWWAFDDDNETLQECRDRKLQTMPVLSGGELEVLRQCRQPVWDGNVVSKSYRDALYEKGLIERYNGWQVISYEGLAVLEFLGELKE